MYIKISTFELKNLLLLTNRFLGLESIYKDIDVTKLAHTQFSKLDIEKDQATNNYIIIYMKKGSEFMKTAFILDDEISQYLIKASIDIVDIINIEKLIVYKSLFLTKKIENLENINVMFIEGKDKNYTSNAKITYLDNLLLNLNESGTINKDVFNTIFKNDKSLLPENTNSSVFNYLFKRYRKKEPSFFKLNNPWLTTHLKINTIYLSVENLKQVTPSKKMNCPVCSTEHNVNDNLIKIINGNLQFNCEHQNTLFEGYNPFIMDISIFKEDIALLEGENLFKYVKHNVQPRIRNGIYVVQVLTYDTIEYLLLKNFIAISKNKFDDDNQDMLKNISILKEWDCPICSKKYTLDFSENDTGSRDILDNEYIHFEKMFEYNDKTQEIEFKCSHKDTEYYGFKKISIIIKKNNYNSIQRALHFVNTYHGHYLDGKRIIIYVTTTNSLKFVDLANYL